MAKKKRKSGYNTNLASEFYVLSMLHRRGINATLTLGNKKAIDIFVEKRGEVLTIDVKGLLEKSAAFPVDNVRKKENHFIIFVSFKDIKNPESLPEVYIVPSRQVRSLTYVNPKKTRKVVNLRKLRKLKRYYKDKWNYFE